MSNVSKLAQNAPAHEPVCVAPATREEAVARETYIDSVERRGGRVVHDGGWSHVMQNAFAKIRKCGIPGR